MSYCIDYINRIVYSSAVKKTSTVLGVVFISESKKNAVGSGSGIVHMSKDAFYILKRHELVDKADLVKVFQRLEEFFLCDHKVFINVMQSLRREGIVFREYLKNETIAPTPVPRVEYDLSIFYKTENNVPLIPVPSVSDKAMEYDLSMEYDLYSFDEAASMYWTANLGEFNSDEYLENMDMY